MVITAASTVEMLRKRFPRAILETVEYRNEQTVVLDPDQLVKVCSFLRDECQYTMLETITAVDWPTRVPRFDVVYQLLSIPNQCFLRLKVRIGEYQEDDPSLPSVTSVWPGANWYEREVFDLFGISFTGHPDLRRILMPIDWTTHPLRKDYPLTGFELPEPYWGGQIPYDTDPGIDSKYYQQTLRTAGDRELNENRSKLNPEQEPGTNKS